MRSISVVIVALALSTPATASPIVGSVAAGRACQVPLARAYVLPQVVDMPDAYMGNQDNSVEEAIQGWEAYIMTLGSNARISAQAAEALRAELLSAAQRDALQWPQGWNRGDHRPSGTLYYTIEPLFPALIAYIQSRNSFSEAEQTVMEDWFGRLIQRVSRTDIIREWEQDGDNKGMKFGAILAAYGYLKRDGGLLGQSQDIYRSAIRSMRPDGSMPEPSGRGGSALMYTAGAIANLVAIAEINHAAGYDLYSMAGRDGQSIHTAIQFLAAATADSSLIAGYANTPGWEQGSFAGYSPTNQDTRWIEGDAATFGYYYLRRFGDTATGQALLAVSPVLSQGQIIPSQLTGGNARCFVG